MSNKNAIPVKALYGPTLILLIAVLVFSFSYEEKEAIRVSYDPAPTKHYFKTGSNSTKPVLRMLPTTVVHVTGVVPTTGNGGTLDVSWLSSLGVTVLDDVQVSIQRGTSTVTDIADVAIKSRSMTAITYNIKQGNNTVISVLGANISSNIFPTNLSDITLNFTLTCY